MVDPVLFRDLVSGRRQGLMSGLLRGLLWGMSFPYRCGVQLRNYRFDRGQGVVHTSLPVIAVGNVTAGGTGKTPFVEWICRWFRARNYRVAILSRGYGAAADAVNDEAKQLEHLLPDVPHLQSPDRVHSAEIAAEELASQLLVLDDGFQHRRLARQLDLVLIDATNPFGYGYLLPRGLLREPLKNLRRANLLALTRVNQVSPADLQQLHAELQRLAPGVPRLETAHAPTHLRDADGQVMPLVGVSEAAGEHEMKLESHAVDLRSQPVLAFCGIGNPESFRQTLLDLECELLDFQIFPDHHGYSREDVASLQQWVAEYPAATRVLCTHKDLVKLSVLQLASKPLAAIGIELQIQSGQQELEQALEQIRSLIVEDSDHSEDARTMETFDAEDHTVSYTDENSNSSDDDSGQ